MNHMVFPQTVFEQESFGTSLMRTNVFLVVDMVISIVCQFFVFMAEIIFTTWNHALPLLSTDKQIDF